jgi:hypothetical protein
MQGSVATPARTAERGCSLRVFEGLVVWVDFGSLVFLFMVVVSGRGPSPSMTHDHQVPMPARGSTPEPKKIDEWEFSPVSRA